MESYTEFSSWCLKGVWCLKLYEYLKQEATSWGSKRQVASNRERKTEISKKEQL